MSKLLVSAIRDSGIDNIEVFEALLKNDVMGESWNTFYAVNILGIVSCADLAASQYVEIGKRPNGLPLIRFQKLVVDPKKTGGALFFRLAESPGQILIQDFILSRIDERKPAEGWGISTFPVDQSPS